MAWTNLRAELAPRQKTGPVAWREAGSGPPLLLIHGVGLNADAWEPQIVHLAARRRVIAPDLPGHGESDPLELDADLEDFVTAMAVLADTLEVAPLPVIGHSLGALMALGLALDHPDMVSCLVALNAVYCRDPQARAAVAARAKQIDKGTIDAAGPISRWYPDDQNGPLARASTRWLRAMKPKNYAIAYRIFATADHAFEGRLRSLGCPALFLTGVADPNSTPAMSSRMAREAPHAHAVAVPRARHMMHLTHPAETNAAITGFLNQVCPLR